MTTLTERPVPQALDGTTEAVEHLKKGLAQGQPWFIALLEAMALWSLPEETVEGYTNHYLVGGEAFDWLRLAERLLDEVKEQVPEPEITQLLFEGQPPLELRPEEFRRLLGSEKYRAYLNFFYGVIVEEALLLAVEEEAHKKWWCRGYKETDGIDEVFHTLYAAPQQELWEKFCEQRGFRRQRQISLYQLKEFTYWLFRRRLGLWDKARIASDTKKGIRYLHQQRRREGGRTWSPESCEADYSQGFVQADISAPLPRLLLTR